VGRIAVAFLLIAGVACGENGQTRPDGSIDGVRFDMPSTLTLEISVTGCDDENVQSCGPDGGAGRCCSGGPPLALSFAPLGSPELTRFLWTFGDGTPTSNERAPVHTYAHPGSYRVTLVGGGDGIGSTEPRDLNVVVKPLAAGSPCDLDVQCGADLTCLCAAGDGCAATFIHGICSAACDTAACGSGAVCAMAPAAAIGAGASMPRCLAACQASAQCAPGFVCQTFPAGPTQTITPWTRGCFPLGAARDVGGSCRDAGGGLVNGACATGLCADLGALGVCSAACDADRPCPDRTSCAALTGGRQLCLLSCVYDADCGGDPLMACAAARPMDSTQVANVCRPRSCTMDAACAPSGRCGPDGVCIPR
jgi:PKD repeat protein